MRATTFSLPALGAIVLGLGCDFSSAPTVRFTPCGATSASLSGRVGTRLPFENKKVALVEGETEIEWSISDPDSDLDGIDAEGPVTPGAGKSRSFTATGTSSIYEFTITGKIDPNPTPPPPCVGSGTWVVKDVDGPMTRGNGTWTIP